MWHGAMSTLTQGLDEDLWLVSGILEVLAARMDLTPEARAHRGGARRGRAGGRADPGLRAVAAPLAGRLTASGALAGFSAGSAGQRSPRAPGRPGRTGPASPQAVVPALPASRCRQSLVARAPRRGSRAGH